MNRLLHKILFLSIFLVSATITVKATCPDPAAVVIEVCNDAGGNGTIRAYFYDGDPGVSYLLFNVLTFSYVSDPLGPVTVNSSIPLPPGAVAGVEFGLVPNGEYVIRVNCAPPAAPPGYVLVGGAGIDVNSANAVAVGVTVDPDCNPLSGGANADGSITLNLSGGVGPYDVIWPIAVTAIPNTINAPAGNY